MLAFAFGPDWIWVLLVVVVLFGGSQLPKLAKNTGEAMKELRKAHEEASGPGAPVVSQPVAPGAPASAVPAPQVVGPVPSPMRPVPVPPTAAAPVATQLVSRPAVAAEPGATRSP